MKKVAAYLFLFFLGVAPAGAQGGFADAFIRGAEAGASLRQSRALREYYERQAQLAETQARLIEAQIQQLEAAEKRAREVTAERPNANSPEVQAAIVAQVQAVLEVFTLIHPDWKQRESQMLAFAQKVAPTAETSTIEYLEILYTLAKAKNVS